MILLFFSAFLSAVMLSTYLLSTFDPKGSLSRTTFSFFASILMLSEVVEAFITKEIKDGAHGKHNIE